jgi:hypothetical protein
MLQLSREKQSPFLIKKWATEGAESARKELSKVLKESAHFRRSAESGRGAEKFAGLCATWTSCATWTTETDNP